MQSVALSPGEGRNRDALFRQRAHTVPGLRQTRVQVQGPSIPSSCTLRISRSSEGLAGPAVDQGQIGIEPSCLREFARSPILIAFGQEGLSQAIVEGREALV